MAGLTSELRGSLDGSDEPLAGAAAPSFGEVPLPDFARSRRRTGVTFESQPEMSSSSVASHESMDISAELSNGSSVEVPAEEVSGRPGRLLHSGGVERRMNPIEDPWIRNDPWATHVAENWSETSSLQSASGDGDAWENWSGSSRSWHSWSSERWSNQSGGGWHDWQWKPDDGSSSAGLDRNSNWSWRQAPLQSGHLDRVTDLPGIDHDLLNRHASDPIQGYDSGQGHGNDQSRVQGNAALVKQMDPASPVAASKDLANRPSGEIPSGVPSIAGNGSQQAMAPGGKISSTYPPIFYARPGESWEQYWRSVMFWIASEGRSLPEEMRGPRLMQQLRERAGKIVQHLSVEEVSSAKGIDVIRATMERSPIIKLLDQKKVDQRRQKFMRLSRLPQESLESFINRAEIYRRENQSSPAYQVGSQFYVGHLLDAAKLTKRDQALIKAACGGTLEDEDLVTNAIIDLADQLEGLPGCPIGRGEPTLDQEDRYLVQKAGVATTLSPSTSTSTAPSSVGTRRRKKFFGRRRFRDALMAILEDDDGMEEDVDEEQQNPEQLGEESMDEDEEDMTSFGHAALETAPSSNASSTASSSASSSELALAEIYAQEYKARNRVREIKKMRQYFQKEANGGGSGNSRDREQVRKWVKEQQKTEPCFICRQLGHWSQECPYRNKAPVHASNVTFPVAVTQSEADWAYLKACVQSDAKYKVRSDGSGKPQTSVQLMVESNTDVHDVCWSLAELGDSMILDLGCMKTVAGTSWVNPIVQRWKAEGHFVKVVPESESFRFGDGHVNQSRFAIILHVSIATIPCLLRISVVAGNCPPLLSKPVCSALGLVVDTSAHTVSSRKHGVKAFGLTQSRGGHYVLKIDEIDKLQAVPEHAHLEPHREALALQFSSGSKVMFASPNDQGLSTDPSFSDGIPGVLGGDRSGPERVVGRDGVGRGGAGESSDLFHQEDSNEAPSTDDFSGNQDSSCTPAGSQQHAAGPDARDAGADAGNVHADAGTPTDFIRGEDQGRQETCQQGQERQQGVNRQAGSTHQSGSSLSDPVQRFLGGFDFQCDPFPDVSVGGVQMEAGAPHATHSQRGGVRWQETLEEEPTLAASHAWTPPGILMGTHRIGEAAVLQSKGLPSGLRRDSDDGCRGRAAAAVSGPQQKSGTNIESVNSDPNAPTMQEQLRRAQDRADIVCPDTPLANHQGDVPQAAEGIPDNLHAESKTSMGRQKITLNRRQKRSILAGVQRALRTHQRMYDVVKMKYKRWSLMEIFAGRATLSELARQSDQWDVLPPQDVLYGLDLLNEEHQQMLKDVIDAQQPEVITLSPPCGPWSSWQRMRKRKDILSALRREHQPFWDFVLWVWSYQSVHGRLVVLEQPAQSDALKMPKMERRSPLYGQVVHMCKLGLVDQESGKPHKKPTMVQMNHPCINSSAFPPVVCDHEPGEHQPIEGSVRLQDFNGPGRHVLVRRSTLASRWTEQFCTWLLTGLECALHESAQEIHVALPDQVPLNRIWENVPADVEPTPEGQLRQHMKMVENGTRYEYINFSGGAALLHRTIRSTLAHLHVALGHISNEKLQRMLQLNGAQSEIIQAVKHLQCQICAQVTSPQATPKAAFQRPMAFNERIVADTFYVWDSNNEKFAVTHVLDAFALYQIAAAAKDPSADVSSKLLRDRWFGVFGPPSVLMTDQGTEFRGILEPLLNVFAVFHDVVPPTAHWRMSLAERHGAVLKVLLMKVIKEVTLVGLEELQMAVVQVTAARNRQARVSGFSPVQLVFGKDCSMPQNLMDTLAGHMQFQLSRPASTDDSFHRTAQMRKAAMDAFHWMESHEALKRAAGSRSRLPRLELITEGAQVMFYEPPANRRGLARRLQDDISWVGPALVVAIERKDGAVKRVWLRYQNKLKGMPLEYIRMAVVEEQEATSIAREALKDMEKQLVEGRVNADTQQHQSPPPTRDYWVLSVEDGELCRVHVQPRLYMFDVLAFHRDEPDSEAPLKDLQLPGGLTQEWITGVRATQVYYLHNPLRWGQARQVHAATSQADDPFGRRTPGQMMNEFILDNVNWQGQGVRPRWNTQQDLQTSWQGITRFQIRDPDDPPATLCTWMRARHFAEDVWRDGRQMVEAFVSFRDAVGWPNVSVLNERLGSPDDVEVKRLIDHVSDSKQMVQDVQLELQEILNNFVNYAGIPCPPIPDELVGISELTDVPDAELFPDATRPETGKVRLELKWSDLSPAWQKAFEQPILDALEVYFRHDALSPVMEDDVVSREEVLPSRFVLVNKSDPRNIHPSDEALEGALLKARLVIAGHRDVRAGDFETESPTASLLAHNMLCFLAAQWKWKMSFADISAAFLQGDYLPAERRVFVQTPKNYPLFVRQFLQTKIPAGARTDMFRMKKAGFGLAESPRLWYHRFKRGTESIGGKELRLCPGLFSFFGPAGDLQALLAVHVDDVRLIAAPEHQEDVKQKLNSLFSFGDWKHPDDWTKFCGRYEKQLEDGTVLVQMDDYAERILSPPQRPSGNQRHPLQPNEKKWIGTIAGQLNR
eukprot:s919_g13.t1